VIGTDRECSVCGKQFPRNQSRTVLLAGLREPGRRPTPRRRTVGEATLAVPHRHDRWTVFARLRPGRWR